MQNFPARRGRGSLTRPFGMGWELAAGLHRAARRAPLCIYLRNFRWATVPRQQAGRTVRRPSRLRFA
ncbi:hypothetical protein PCAR4_340041 [Paraburkholderia caribensis]|nr:hypothetical protein PCAR4_340041 [Paraburkholderia caribensis]